MARVPHRFGFSLIIPLYKSEETIEHLLSRLEALEIDTPWQVIFVDDGSPDKTYKIIHQRLQHSPLEALLIRHTRNFGEHQAVLTGYRHAEGEYFINIDDDLQNPPEEALRLLEYAVANDLDVVYGNYVEKKHNLFRNLGSDFANLTARLLLDLPKSYYLSSFRCVRRLIGERITTVSSPYVYIDGLLSQATQQIGSLDVQHDQRDSGVSNYNIRRLVRLWLVILTSFSLMPLRIASFIGLIAATIGAISLSYILLSSVFGTIDVAGWPSVISAILFFGGVQCLLLGLLGEYVGRIYLTVYGKPQALIRTIEIFDSLNTPEREKSVNIQ
jgi:undecaprenyl-phosphate 4-deoxy-4-formamido-L-arabinose transferase